MLKAFAEFADTRSTEIRDLLAGFRALPTCSTLTASLRAHWTLVDDWRGKEGSIRLYFH